LNRTEPETLAQGNDKDGQNYDGEPRSAPEAEQVAQDLPHRDVDDGRIV
jgi:hypothetical protein